MERKGLGRAYILVFRGSRLIFLPPRAYSLVFVVDEKCVAARATPVTEEKKKLLAVYTFRFSKMLDKTT